MKHVLFETGDADAPEIIKDRNGEVVLGLCKICGKGEAELEQPCVVSVPDRLQALGDLYRERNKLYGSNYKHFGHILVGMYPEGVTLKTAEEFNRFALLLQLMHKLTRYARSVNNGGHLDSLDDLAVYAQMMAEYDDDIRGSQDQA